MIGIILISNEFAGLHASLDESCISAVKYLKAAGASAVYLVGHRSCFASSFGMPDLPQINGVTCKAVDFNPFNLASLLKHFNSNIAIEKVCVIDAAYTAPDDVPVEHHIIACLRDPDNASYGFYVSDMAYPLTRMGCIARRDLPHEHVYYQPYLRSDTQSSIGDDSLLCFFIINNSAVQHASGNGTLSNEDFLNLINCKFRHVPVNPNSRSLRTAQS